MTVRALWFTVMAAAAILLGIGLVGAWFGVPSTLPPMSLYAQDTDTGIAVEIAATSTSISYQGRLTSAEDEALDGPHFLRFRIYDAASEGTVLWDSDTQEVSVNEGLFTANLDIDPTLFDGRELWLQINVNGQPLTPRRPLLPAPYALGLAPGAMVAGAPYEASGQTLGARLAPGFADGKALGGYAPATGTAIRAQAGGGDGVFASSEQSYGVRGSSAESWGGRFDSSEGYGVVATTGGTDHWDHAGIFRAQEGYGLLGESVENMAVRGHAGEIGETEPGEGDALWQPVGNVGVVGLGASRGVYGSSRISYGIYGTSLNWYGVYGRTSRENNDYGLYTPDNLGAANITTSGASMLVTQNGSDETLQPGDVVAASGIGDIQTSVDEPLLRVAKADDSNSHALAGVVYRWYNPDALAEDFDPGDEEVELVREGPIQGGDALLIVTHGIAPVNVDSVDAGIIEAGDALTVGSTQGMAASMDSMDEAAMATNGAPIRAIGTALESGAALAAASDEQKQIRVFVTLR